MSVSLTSTGIQFPDSTIQTTAAGAGGVTSLNGQTGAIVNTNIDAIGSIVKAAYIVRLGTPPGGGWSDYFLNAGTAVAGSNLRYNPSASFSRSPFNYLDLYWEEYTFSGENPGTWSNYGGGGTSLSGTWRCLGRIVQQVSSSWDDVGGNYYYWYTTGCYFVRVS